MSPIKIFFSIIITVFASQVMADQLSPNPQVQLSTEKGNIIIELFPQQAPITVDNFIKLVNDYHYDGLIFHRVIKDFMIQSGGFTFDFTPRESARGSIEHESFNGLQNSRGTVAMARTSAPDSATAQFFINHRDNHRLDGSVDDDKPGYTVFGRVINGMQVVDTIASVKTTRIYRFADVPVQPIRILTVRLLNPKAWTPLEEPKEKIQSFERPIPQR